MTVIVLMNLLNGMAIGDVAEVKKKGKILSQSSRVETIVYFERSVASKLQFVEQILRRFKDSPASHVEGSLCQDIIVFHPKSNQKKIIIHQEEREELSIICCKLLFCAYNGERLKLSQRLNTHFLRDVTKILIDKNMEKVNALKSVFEERSQHNARISNANC